MPEYEFQLGDGRVICEYFPMADAPGIGEVVEIRGQPATRILSQIRQTNRSYGHTAHSLPPWDPRAPRHDEDGQPVFTSKKEIDEYAAKSGRVYQ